MTTIVASFTRPNPYGSGDIPIRGTVIATLLQIDSPGDAPRIVRNHSTEIVNGDVRLVVPGTTDNQAYVLKVVPSNKYISQRTVKVPAGPPVDWEALVDVNPFTFEPSGGGGYSPQEQAQIQGFWIIASPDEPSETTMYDVPVVWIDTTPSLEEVPVLPEQPAWRDTNSSVVIPSLVGVNYKIDNEVVTGTLTFTPPTNVTITAEAAPGYYLTGEYSWTHSFPDPGVITLISSETFSGEDAATITGRTLDNADGGTTTLTWQKTASNPEVFELISNQASQIIYPTGRQSVYLDTQTPYLRLEFDVIQGGTGNSEFIVSVGNSTETGGGPRGTISLISGQVRFLFAGAEQGPRLNSIPLGTYAIQLFGDTVRIEIPGEQTRFGTAEETGGTFARFQTYGGTGTTPAIFDNIKLFKVG